MFGFDDNEKIFETFVNIPPGTIFPCRYKAEIKKLDDLLRDNENNVDAYLSRGYINLKMGYHYVIQLRRENKLDFDWVLRDFKKALELNPDWKAYFGHGLAVCLWLEVKRLDHLYRPQGKKALIDQALSDFTRVIEERPDFAEAYYQRGIVYKNIEQTTKAISDFTQALQINNNYVMALNERAALYRTEEMLDHAISDYTQLINIVRYPREDYLKRGDTYMQNGQPEQAIANYQRLLKIEVADGEVISKLAMAYQAAGYHHEAVSVCRLFLKKKPESCNFMKVMVHKTLAKIFEISGLYEKAFINITQAIALDPKHGGLYRKRASVYVKMGENHKALEDLTSCINILIEDDGFDLWTYDRVFIDRGILYSQIGEFESALQDFDRFNHERFDEAYSANDIRGLKDDPLGCLSALFNKAKVFDMMGCEQQSVEIYKNFISLLSNAEEPCKDLIKFFVNEINYANQRIQIIKDD